MQPVEFIIELKGDGVVVIPPEVAAQLPKRGPARVVILTPPDAADAAWQRTAHEQFLRDDAADDAVYDTY